MANLLRREFLIHTATAAAALGVATSAKGASFGNPDSPPEGRINGKSPTSLDDPGPKNPALADQFPSFQNPPPTDVNGMPQFWASFNNAHKRYQNGGGGSGGNTAGLLTLAEHTGGHNALPPHSDR